VAEGIEDALNLIVSTTERSGNMNKELKQTMYETVRTLRNISVKLKNISDVKSSKISELEEQVTKTKAELQGCIDKTVTVHGAPSVILSQELTGLKARGMAAPGGRERELYSAVVANEAVANKFKLTVKSTENQPPETIKGLLKSKINPTEIKVGISTFKSLKNGRILVGTNSKEE